MNKKHAGFTLLELIIVIVIVGIITSFAMPNFEQTAQSNAVRKMSNAMENDLKLARIEAMTRGSRVFLCPVDNINIAPPISCSLTNWTGFAASGSGNGNRGWMVYQRNVNNPIGASNLNELIKLTKYEDVNGKAVIRNVNSIGAVSAAPNSFSFNRKGMGGRTGTIMFGRQGINIRQGKTVRVIVSNMGRVRNDNKEGRGN